MKVTALVLHIAIAHAVGQLGGTVSEGFTQAGGDVCRFFIIQINHLQKKAGNSNTVARA